MEMNTQQIIQKLKTSNLFAECSCGGEFKLKDSVLFDGTKIFPEKALEIQKELQDELKERENELKKNKILATKKSEITTVSVNIGKNVEKILPTFKDFDLSLPDCRFLGDPIDLLNFSGLILNKVKYISFIEVKSGGSRLQPHQKSIKDAIEDGKLRYLTYR